MIYYHIPTDRIFLSGTLDAYFFGLVNGVKWDDIEILDYL